jgi:hypothetical protein
MEQLDQLYLDDAGLVILWPFLPRFFARLSLLDEDERFTGEAAVMQAIALLDFLATEDPNPPEYRLPLAKLLCGLAPDERHALLEPLPPAALAEAEHLLRSVIEQIPILGDMASPRFRASFLRREGVLTIHQGAWRLQVTHQPHDVVLERLGWSWAWIKLPWMPDPLRVEW